MKKEYITPNVRKITLRIEQLLALSGGDYGGVPGGDAKRNNVDFPDWDKLDD